MIKPGYCQRAVCAKDLLPHTGNVGAIQRYAPQSIYGIEGNGTNSGFAIRRRITAGGQARLVNTRAG